MSRAKKIRIRKSVSPRQKKDVGLPVLAKSRPFISPFQPNRRSPLSPRLPNDETKASARPYIPYRGGTIFFSLPSSIYPWHQVQAKVLDEKPPPPRAGDHAQHSRQRAFARLACMRLAQKGGQQNLGITLHLRKRAPPPPPLSHTFGARFLKMPHEARTAPHRTRASGKNGNRNRTTVDISLRWASKTSNRCCWTTVPRFLFGGRGGGWSRQVMVPDAVFSRGPLGTSSKLSSKENENKL